MKKIDRVVIRETLYISAWSLIFSAIMQAVFLIMKKWDVTVLYANLYSCALCILNFFLMAYSVQLALAKDQKEAKNTVKLSQSLRMIFLFALICVGATLPCFNIYALLFPLIFPRVAIALRRQTDDGVSEPTDNEGEKAEKAEEASEGNGDN